MAHSERGHTILNFCGFTERQIKFQRFFSVFVFRCKTHCNVYGGIRLRDCAYPPSFNVFAVARCHMLHFVSEIVAHGKRHCVWISECAPAVYLSGEDCTRGARSELYVFFFSM